MIFVKSFKGYEDKVVDMDAEVNKWILQNRVDVVGVQTALSHERDGGSRMHSGDLIYTVLYRSNTPIG